MATLSRVPHRLFVWVGLAALGFGSVSSLRAGVDTFLKITNIAGESTDATHPNEINVLSWSWGVTQAATSTASGGGGTGKASAHDFSFTKAVDKSSPVLMQGTFSGTHYNTAVLVVRSQGASPLEFLKYTFSDVLITSYQISGAANAVGGELSEQVSLSFAKVQVSYFPVKADGTPGPEVKSGWDILANKAL